MATINENNLIPVDATKLPEGHLAVRIGDYVHPIGISVPTGIDTNDATATAGQILEGATAYVKGHKVTGTINTVTPKLSANTFTVAKGYVSSNTVLSVPVVEATNDGTTVTVPVGYIAEEQTFEVGGGSGSFEPPAETTAVLVYNFLGAVSGDPDSNVATAAVSIAVEEAGWVAGSLNLEWVEDIAALPYTEYTPTTTDIYISSDRWLNGAQVIKGDSNLKSENIRDGVSIFGVAGSFAGMGSDAGTGGGGGSFVKITAYSAYKPAASVVSSIQISGFTSGSNDDYGDWDYTGWNGTYVAQNPNNRVLNDQVFQHSDGSNKFLYRVEDSEGYAYWIFNASVSSDASYYWALFYNDDLAGGTWSGGEDTRCPYPTLTLTTADTNFPEEPAVIEAVGATLTDNGWELGGAVQISEFERTPTKNGIYLHSANKLVGDPIAAHCSDMYMPTDGLIMYFPVGGDGDTLLDVVSGLRLAKIGEKMTADDSYWWSPTERGAVIGTCAAFTLPKTFTLSARVACTGQSGSRTNVFEFGLREQGTGLGIRCNCVSSNSADYGLRIGYNEDTFPITDIPYGENEWHTVTFVFNGTSFVCKSYLDGALVSTGNYSSYYSVRNAETMEMFSRFVQANTLAGGESFIGKISDVMLWDRELTDAEVATLVR